MSQIEQYLAGERSYPKIRGGTGPLVYPAAHVYTYTALYHATDKGRDIGTAQGIFAFLYLFTLGVVMMVYRKCKVCRLLIVEPEWGWRFMLDKELYIMRVQQWIIRAHSLIDDRFLRTSIRCSFSRNAYIVSSYSDASMIVSQSASYGLRSGRIKNAYILWAVSYTVGHLVSRCPSC